MVLYIAMAIHDQALGSVQVLHQQVGGGLNENADIAYTSSVNFDNERK